MYVSRTRGFSRATTWIRRQEEQSKITPVEGRALRRAVAAAYIGSYLDTALVSPRRGLFRALGRLENQLPEGTSRHDED